LEGRDEGGCVHRIHQKATRVKYEKAAECLNQDRDVLLILYDFPAEHWKHLRTTNPGMMAGNIDNQIRAVSADQDRCIVVDTSLRDRVMDILNCSTASITR
jgi:hypothetical protein